LFFGIGARNKPNHGSEEREKAENLIRKQVQQVQQKTTQDQL